jgi:para-aminobenzoate synthetase/4-amino-4-deoxychorismate lyase
VRISLSPDPAKGVFETMLVLDGRAVELEAHLRRLDASVSSLFGAELPRGTHGNVVSRARPIEHGKLRLTVVPAGRTVSATISTTELERPLVFPAREAAVALRSVAVDDGLGAHKWADRALLEGAEAVEPGTVPLLLDRDGWVLEASRGSVFAARGGRLLTPPSDGRILPGIARRRVIEVAAAQGVETQEARLSLDDLRAAEVFLAGSVRGVEPARSVDGFELPRLDEVGRRLASGLRRRWLQVPQAESAANVAIGRRAGRLVR